MKLRLISLITVLAGVAIFSLQVRADVLESSSTGFVVKSVATIAAPSGKVYRALVNDIGRWWDSEHTYSGDARNLSIDPRPGGCFCERLPGHGGVQHLQVIYVVPGKKLRLAGGLGPLQESAVSGVLTWDISDSADSSEVTLTYAVGGYRKGLEDLASPVDKVLGSQLHRFKSYVEHGKPVP